MDANGHLHPHYMALEGYTECHANAQAISAVPDMLEALEALAFHVAATFG